MICQVPKQCDKQKFLRLQSRAFASNGDVDLYGRLGVDATASQADIKRAFLKQAQKYHPDRNSSADAKEKFAAINEAYETLGNEQKR